MKKISILLACAASMLLLTQCNSATSSESSPETAAKADCSTKACCAPLDNIDESQPLTYQGCAGGIGEGKHIVLIAADHEYRAEETIPALARILAKTYGFTCTVLFSVDEQGYLKSGYSNIPHMDKLDGADMMILFARFLNLPDEQMTPFINFLTAGKPILGLRTSTHAIKNDGKGKYPELNWQAKDTNFGRLILGEGWAGHYGGNHRQSTAMPIVPENANHPILTGVESMWVECGGYGADPREGAVILTMAQPLNGMTPDSPADPKKEPVPGFWTIKYQYNGGPEGQAITTTHGASEDLRNDGFRRALVNSTLWALGLEDKIKADSNIDFIGTYQPSTFNLAEYVRNVKPLDHAGWETPIPVRLFTPEDKAIATAELAKEKAEREAKQKAYREHLAREKAKKEAAAQKTQ